MYSAQSLPYLIEGYGSGLRAWGLGLCGFEVSVFAPLIWGVEFRVEG